MGRYVSIRGKAKVGLRREWLAKEIGYRLRHVSAHYHDLSQFAPTPDPSPRGGGEKLGHYLKTA